MDSQSHESTSRRDAPAKGWTRLNSPAIKRQVALELSVQFEQLSLPTEVEAIIKNAARSAELPVLFDHLDVWVDTSSLHVLARQIDEEEWTNAVLRYCIRRQANYPLLNRLFAVTRHEVTQHRAELGAKPPSPKRIELGDALGRAIWQTWKSLQTEHEIEAERWVTLAEVYPDLALSTLYQFLIVEGKAP
ncbi:MAG: DUF2857 family protein [Burkholderiaceae bacterium]|nr:DUF2857 family protein [Burkholderiaceae bacterium]